VVEAEFIKKYCKWNVVVKRGTGDDFYLKFKTN
jgi:hypothetical protein